MRFFCLYREKVQGIYKITNILDNKIYIGSSINISNRIKQHFYMLESNKHKCSHLQNAFNLYGREVFKHETLEEIRNNDQLLTREQYFLDLFKSYNRTIGYNVCLSASHSRLGISHTALTKEKISKIFKDKKLSPEHRDKVIKNLQTGKEMSSECRTRLGNERRKLKAIDIEKIIVLYQQGLTQKEIAIIYNCSKMLINRTFLRLYKENRIKKRSVETKEHVLWEINNSALLQSQIATKLNISRSLVTHIKNNLGDQYGL